jgi:hypothetical protein
VVAAAVVAFLVAGLLGSEALVGLARRQPFGWSRSVALTSAEGVDRVAHALSLDRPVRTARHWMGKDRPTYDVDALIGQANGGTAPASPAPGSTSGNAADATGSKGTSGLPARTADTPRRVPSAADPLRVYVGGDSMARELGDGLARVAPVDLSAVEQDYRVSTGLSRPDFFDWPGRLAQVIVEHHPDVFVVVFGTNDAQNLETASGVLSTGTQAWLAEYRARVARVMDLLHQPGTTTVWVGMPVMRSSAFDADMAALDTIYAEEASGRPWISYVDSRALFASPSGGYADRVANAEGEVVSLRQEDGVHWSTEGATRIGHAAWDAIARQWGLPAG